jgi:acyl-coenzyme A thioesterase PaaI-like protein
MTEPQQPQTGAPGADGAVLAQGWLENSPFVTHLGIQVGEMERDRAVLSRPFNDSLPR